MLRKLTALSLIAAGIAALLKKRKSEATYDFTPAEPASAPDPAKQDTDESPAVRVAPPPAPAEDDLAEVRSGQTAETMQAPIPGAGDQETSVTPDISDDDAIVREQEAAAAADAGSIGGDPDTVTADADPEMRPVVEGAGDAPETFETTDEQGR